MTTTEKDFEDAVLYFCAKKIDAELIITHNIRDFKLSDIRVISAKDFYKPLATFFVELDRLYSS